MAKKQSAGILLYRLRDTGLEVLLVHPGGPYWVRKDAGAWSIPKGEFGHSEDSLEAARREFHEETGTLPTGSCAALAPLTQRSGKVIYAWAMEGDLDAASIRSNIFTMEWPPRSGRLQDFPEVDRAAWFTMAAAREKLSDGQRGFLDQLEQLLRAGGAD